MNRKIRTAVLVMVDDSLATAANVSANEHACPEGARCRLTDSGCGGEPLELVRMGRIPMKCDPSTAATMGGV